MLITEDFQTMLKSVLKSFEKMHGRLPTESESLEIVEEVKYESDNREAINNYFLDR